jgi:acyl-CoA dehydrogenase
MRGVIDNFPIVPARWLMRAVVFPFGSPYRPASDVLGHRIVRLVLEAPELRDRMTRHIFVSKDPDDPTGLLEVTMKKAIAAEEAERKLERAIRSGALRRYHGIDWIGEAMAKGIVTESEGQQLREVEALIARAIAVDHFDPEELKPHYGRAGHNSRSAATTAAE